MEVGRVVAAMEVVVRAAAVRAGERVVWRRQG